MEVKFEHNGIKYLWEDCTIGFICPNCKEELIVDSQDGEEECDCGFKYSLSVNLKLGK